MQSEKEIKNRQTRRFYIGFILSRAYSVLIIAALLCTLIVKLFHALRYHLLGEYLGWVMADISFFLIIEVILALICYRWPKKWVVRIAILVAAVICTWSVMNAGWLIRTGHQILLRHFLSLIRSPVNGFCMIGVNLVKMPKASFLLLGPSALALVFFFYVLVKTTLPSYNKKRLTVRIAFSIVICLLAVAARPVLAKHGSRQASSFELQCNSQLRAVFNLAASEYVRAPEPERKIPKHDEINVSFSGQRIRENIIVVVLEGVQYRHTSLSGDPNDLTPFLKKFAGQGVEFPNMRSSLTHTTKALFALLTGRYPSSSHDIAEAVPVNKPYASIATILDEGLGYRTAFFQSAKGDFECRPGLVYNLGFQKFWSRDDLVDQDSFVGYLGCDEFSLLEPVSEWIKSDDRPFFLAIMCSVTHDPYEVPEWFGMPAKEPIDRYKQTISYTDDFLAALDVEIAKLNLSDKTIFCIVGDHGEGFGEHEQLGHERISYDEVLRVPFCLRAPYLIDPNSIIDSKVSSVDVTPTLLGLLGFDVRKGRFDGVNVLKPIAADRKVYFSGWMREGPAGYVQNNRKYAFNPIDKRTSVYDLEADPGELNEIEISETKAKEIADGIMAWRKGTIFKIDQEQSGRKKVFDEWLCKWTDRKSKAKYVPEEN
ncbi:MAG: LTA synthase family protein [Sedimentisphaerales bacterium]|nr:LTA synthase family protein [Sedimentisphaerales bacterium]